jgi:hypothetical protein
MRATTGQAQRRGKMGSARIGSSGKLSLSGASRCGMPATLSAVRSSHGPPALTESELAGVPMGGAAMVCARRPHIGAAADALAVHASDSTNAVRVHSRTNQCCRVWVAEGMGRAGGSLVGRPPDTTGGPSPAFLAKCTFQKLLTF